MQDRFRFRHWCIEDKKYCYNSEQMSAIILSNPSDRIIIEQCTGLKDKNGKLIYEGDIVDIKEHIDSVNGLYRVKYDDINHCWALKRNEEYLYNYSYLTFSDLNGFADDCEVVGNIHQEECNDM